MYNIQYQLFLGITDMVIVYYDTADPAASSAGDTAAAALCGLTAAQIHKIGCVIEGCCQASR